MSQEIKKQENTDKWTKETEKNSNKNQQDTASQPAKKGFAAMDQQKHKEVSAAGGRHSTSSKSQRNWNQTSGNKGNA